MCLLDLVLNVPNDQEACNSLVIITYKMYVDFSSSY